MADDQKSLITDQVYFLGLLDETSAAIKYYKTLDDVPSEVIYRTSQLQAEITEFRIQRHVKKLLDPPFDEYNIGSKIHFKLINQKCELCNITPLDFLDHVVSSKHLQKFLELTRYLKKLGSLHKGRYYCTYCETEIEYFELRHHMCHKRYKREIIQKQAASMKIPEENNDDYHYDQFMCQILVLHIDQEVGDQFFAACCYTCDFATQNHEKWKKHFEKETHSQEESCEFSCTTCKVTLAGVCQNEHEENMNHLIIKSYIERKDFSNDPLSSGVASTNYKSVETHNSASVRAGKFLVSISPEPRIAFSEVLYETTLDFNEIIVEKKRGINKTLMRDLNCALMNVQCQKYLYGSRITGLATSKSNCNFFILTLKRGSDKVVKKIHEKISASQTFVPNVKMINENNLLYRCKHSSSNVECLLYLGHRSCCVKITYLIRAYINIDWRVKWLITAFKIIARKGALIGKGLLDSNCIIWLVLFYLMQTELYMIPPVNLMRSENPTDPKSDWICAETAFTSRPRVHHAKSDHEILNGFFKFYSEMDFENYILCPEFGKLQKKESIIQGVNFIHFPLCIQDPFGAYYNLSKSVGYRGLHKFKNVCKHMMETCV